MERIYSWFERRSRSRTFPWILCAVLVPLSWFLAPPCFDCYNGTAEPWEVVYRKAADLTDPLSDIHSNLWLSKKVFRLTVPVLIKLFHLRPLHVMIVHFIFGYLTLLLSYFICRRITKDPSTSVLFTIAITFIYFGRAAFYDMWLLWFDGYAYFFLILAIFSRHPLGIFLAATATAWTDERALIALVAVFLYHQITSRNGPGLAELLLPRLRAISVLIAMAAYLFLRWHLTASHGMHIPSDGAGLAFLQWTLYALPIGAWTILEGLWLVYLAALFMTVKDRHYLLSVILIGSAFAAVIVAGCVSDITRSGSYLAPIIFLALPLLADALRREQLRRLMLYSAVISLLFPATFVCIDWEVQKWLQSPMFIGWARELLVFGLNAFEG